MKTLDVVAAIIERDGKILLAQRPLHADQSGIEAVVGRYIASHQREVSGRLIHLHAWHVPSYQGELKAYEHQDIVWCSPEEALRYPLAPADIPLLEAFILLRDARPADLC